MKYTYLIMSDMRKRKPKKKKGNKLSNLNTNLYQLPIKVTVYYKVMHLYGIK